MTIQTATQKAADTAHHMAEGVLDTASDAVQSTRKMANRSLDKAEAGMHRLHEGVDPLINDLAGRAQDWASRSINYCAESSERARRQFNQAADATSRYVAEQPGKSLLIAATAGAAFAAVVMMARQRAGR